MARGNASDFGYFGGGLNTADGPYRLIEPYFYRHQWRGGECRANMNVVSRHRGNVAKRGGCVALVNDAHTFKDLSILGNGDSSFAVCSSTAGGLYAISSSYVVTQLLAAATLSTTAPWVFLRLPAVGGQGPAYGMNGTDTPRQTDGATAANWTASSGTLPNGTLMEYWQNTLWVAGVSATPYSLFWSDLGDPRTWPADNVTKYDPDDGLPLTALRAAGPYLLVFKERGIWRVYDSTTDANTKIADNVGTLSPRSVVSGPEGTYFLDPQTGVYVTNGQSVQRISESIQPTLDGITDFTTVSAAFHDGHYYLSAVINGVRTILDYDTQLNSWWVHSPTTSRLEVWDRGSGPDLVGLVEGTGKIWQMFVDGELRDDGTIFESYWSGPFHTFGAPHLRKRINEVHLDGRGKVDVYANYDYSVGPGSLEGAENFSAGAHLFGGSTGLFGDPALTFGGGDAVTEAWVYSLGVTRALSISFYSAAEDYWEMDAYSVSVSGRRD